MKPTESDVSVLIPSYRRPEMTLKAVVGALNSGAGEIIVSDDASNDGTVERIATLRDARLKIVVQRHNLGLWPNHRALLLLANRPWVKFLQNDDELVPGGLAAMVDAATPATAVVGAHPILQDAAGRRSKPRDWPRAVVWRSADYLERLCVFGNELGSPSDVLWRRDCLDDSERAWRNEISADLAMNVLCAAHGDVVMVPAGPIVTGNHEGRDMRRQGAALATVRNVNTVVYLGEHPDPRVQRIAAAFSFALGVSSTLAGLGNLRHRRPPPAPYWPSLVRLWKYAATHLDARTLPAAVKHGFRIAAATRRVEVWTPGRLSRDVERGPT